MTDNDDDNDSSSQSNDDDDSLSSPPFVRVEVIEEVEPEYLYCHSFVVFNIS